MATKATMKATTLERSIARRLGLSDAQLAALLAIHGNLTFGGFKSGGNAGIKLEEMGLVTAFGWEGTVHRPRQLTEKGLKVLQEARRLGY